MGELCKTEEQIETLFGRLTHVGSGKLVLDGEGVKFPMGRDVLILWGFRLQSNRDDCRGRCVYKGGFTAAMQPFAKLL